MDKMYLYNTATSGYKCCVFTFAGMLFSIDGIDVQTAFRFEMDKHNNNSSTLFKIEPTNKTVDSSDSVAVYKGSK